MPDPGYRFPGAYSFIAQLAQIHGDANMSGVVARLQPVTIAMSHIENAATAQTPEARNELLRRAADQAKSLQAGIACIYDAIKHVTENYEELDDPTEGQGLMGALPRPEHARGIGPRPNYPGIVTAPIDAAELGATGTARPPGYGAPARATASIMGTEAERIQREGTDEGMSGGPPRPSTGVNQSVNQVNIPTRYEAPVMGAETWKQDRNPPLGEPNETDEGVGPQLAQAGPDQGSGLTQAAFAADRGETPQVKDASAPPQAGQQVNRIAREKSEATAAGKAPKKGGR
jgi:hypothetical protein